MLGDTAAPHIDMAQRPPGLSADAAALITRLQRQVQSQAREIAWAHAKLEKVSFKLARLKRRKFGAKTEAVTAQQRALFQDALAEDEASLQARLAELQRGLLEAPKTPKAPPRKPRRQALPRMGIGMVGLEVPLHILFVTFQAMKRSGHVWPIVSEAVQDRCMQRWTAHARFNERLPADLADQVVQQFCDEHPERDLLRVRTDAEKYLMMAALILVECVAFVGSTNAL